MNNLLFAPRVALIALAMGTAGVTATFAQTTNTPISTAPVTTPPPDAGCRHHHHDHGASVLTTAEQSQLRKAREQALASNGSLKTEEAALKQQRESLKGSNATKDQWVAFHRQKETYKKDLRAAELLVDPTLSSIFAKLDAAHHGHHHS